MENFTKLSLEYKKHVNNQTKHKRQTKQHTMNKQLLTDAFKTFLPFLENGLINVNAEWDSMGYGDLEKYENWLLDVHE